MGAMSKTKKTTKKKNNEQRSRKSAPPKQEQAKEPTVESANQARPMVSLYLPTNKAKNRLKPDKTRPLSSQAIAAVLLKNPSQANRLLEMQASPLLYEADLAMLLKRQEVRQLVLTQTDQGWEVQALPLWKGEFLTLVSLKKERRRYRDLDRIIRTIITHGPLPPTILIGK